MNKRPWLKPNDAITILAGSRYVYDDSDNLLSFDNDVEGIFNGTEEYWDRFTLSDGRKVKIYTQLFHYCACLGNPPKRTSKAYQRLKLKRVIIKAGAHVGKTKEGSDNPPTWSTLQKDTQAHLIGVGGKHATFIWGDRIFLLETPSISSYVERVKRDCSLMSDATLLKVKNPREVKRIKQLTDNAINTTIAQ